MPSNEKITTEAGQGCFAHHLTIRYIHMINKTLILSKD